MFSGMRLSAPPDRKEWRCSECRGSTYARIDERKPDGSFGPGSKVRCVNCKAVFLKPRE